MDRLLGGSLGYSYVVVKKIPRADISALCNVRANLAHIVWKISGLKWD